MAKTIYQHIEDALDPIVSGAIEDAVEQEALEAYCDMLTATVYDFDIFCTKCAEGKDVSRNKLRLDSKIDLIRAVTGKDEITLQNDLVDMRMMVFGR